MKTTPTTSRSEELRAALEAASADLSTARAALGEAVADGDAKATTEARSDVARLERLVSELEAARPIALRREREAADKQGAQRRAEQAREANKNRKARVAAARKVDAALLALGKAYADYLGTAPGGRPEDANRLARRSRSALAAATLHAAPDFAEALDVRRVPTMHRQGLEAAQSHITEFKVEAEPA